MDNKYEILDSYGHSGDIIFKAGTTCYRSEGKTTKSPEDFIKMFKKLKHMSMIEFMWVTIIIKDPNYLVWSGIFSKEKFLISNRLQDGNVVVSGNARAWLEFMPKFSQHFLFTNDKLKKKDLLWITYNTVAELLHAANPVMFDFEYDKVDKPIESSLVQSIDQEDGSLYSKHHWVAIKFQNISRGMIDEFVRHRLMSYAVSSTRYIDNSNYGFIAPPEKDLEHMIIMSEANEYLKECYGRLLKMGAKKDYARQLLPLGIAQEMIVAGTIENWQHIFDLRCKSSAHWEINNVLNKLQKENIFK